MYGIFPLSHPAILHSFLLLQLPHSLALPSFWSYESLCLEQIVLSGLSLIFFFFFNAAGREYPYVVRFAVSLYHRLNLRAHHLCIICEFTTFLSLVEQIPDGHLVYDMYCVKPKECIKIRHE